MKTKTELQNIIREAAAVLCEAVNEAQKDLGIFFDVRFTTIGQLGSHFRPMILGRIQEVKYPVCISIPDEYERMPYRCENCRRREKDTCRVRIDDKYPPLNFVCNQHEDIQIIDE